MALSEDRFSDRFAAFPNIPEGLRRIMGVPAVLPTAGWPAATTPVTPVTPVTPTTAPVTPAPKVKIDVPDPRTDPDAIGEQNKASGHPDFAGMSERMRRMTPAERERIPLATGRERDPRTGRRGGGPVVTSRTRGTIPGFPDFTKFLGVRTPQEAMSLFGGILNNPEIMSRLPPFMRGPNSPFMGIFNRLIGGGQLTAGDFAGLTRNMPPEVAEKLRALGIDPSIVPIEANPIDPATGKFKYGTYSHDNDVPRTGTAPGSTDRGGRTPGSDVPADPDTGTDTGLTDLPGEPSMAPRSSGTIEPDRLPAQPAAGSSPAAPGATDGSTADPTRVGPAAPAGDYPGAGQPRQGWPEADFGPGFEPTTATDQPLRPDQISRPAGALPSIKRQGSPSGPNSAPQSPAPQPAHVPGTAPPLQGAQPPAVPQPIHTSSPASEKHYPPAVTGRNGQPAAAFIVHHTGGRGTVDGVRHTLQQRGLGVQYVVDRKGNITQIGGPGSHHIMTGWGAGKGLSNRNTVGIEVIAKNDRDVTPEQIAAVRDFIAARYPNTPVFGHGQVNPGHKEADEGMTIVNAVRQARSTAPAIAAR